MIDEKKIKRELNTLLEKEKANSPQEKLLKGFMEYINRQPVLSVREMCFRHRMRVVLVVAGMNVVVEVE